MRTDPDFLLDHHATADPTCSQLRHLIVSSHHRRRKIGTVLINAAIEHARSCTPPLGMLELEVSEFEPEARSWYERLGFSVVGMHRIFCWPVSEQKTQRKCF
jgi:ribosomal protein S18 acetylase RimI-like enzyme